MIKSNPYYVHPSIATTAYQRIESTRPSTKIVDESKQRLVTNLNDLAHPDNSTRKYSKEWTGQPILQKWLNVNITV